jgi:hypothetical protein
LPQQREGSTFLHAGDSRHTAGAKEVDDVKNNSTLMTTPTTGLSFAGCSAAAHVAVHGARVLDLPGSPPRGAPV